MDLPTVVAIVDDWESQETWLEAALHNWRKRARASDLEATETVRAQLELLLRLYASQETKSEVTATLHVPAGRIKFIVQSAR